ncbi:MAG: chorismate mutase [Firmicutes bacterium]|nr:chorismate mutase [Bacillota bacterium]
MDIHAVRGATTVPANDAEAIILRTAELLQEMAARNRFTPEQIVFLLFTATPDLNAAFPARAAARLGWAAVPRLDAQEMDVPDALPRCVRVLAVVRGIERAEHVYLHEARRLGEGPS